MERIHYTWDCLKPNENEKPQDLKFEEYYTRISANPKTNHIPKEVLSQWIYPFNQESNSLSNYGWLNYENIRFNLCAWRTEMFNKVNVIENFQNCFLSKSIYSDFKDFCCSEIDLRHWIEKGTWRVPPIIIDVYSLRDKIPFWSDLKPPYQLVEGHTRFGHLKSLQTISSFGKGRIASMHTIYLMQEK